ncbi:tape measure protein [Proteus mirabilis]|uniref:tape measure protein n=2 Tax=Gammaproteobacteria TaxID=1236 RepID=UPI0018C59CE9|nr:tape measure protein [Proteus mirabilis]ELB3501616.1 tape measure protein [Proteus mirabilis]MBG2828650.1 tape measure protein [Proteus mirabilis]MBG3011219.1 tape measure protein [Proteus mirabilis]MBG6011468.1 tape measure protein [Proteus mirabilis]MBG6025593.1 tape measure protein [Proteus mirabilis]
MANVGEIVYQVQMDVRQLLASQQQLEQRLNRMDSSFNRTSQSVNNTERSMQSLSKVAAALTGYLSVSMVASYSEAWTELNNKLSNSVRASESLIDVTQRVFDISQATRSSLDATATLYARLERGTREYNTSAEDLAKLTSIINQGFIVSGATAQEAEKAIIQLSQGIASGVLRGEEFNSVAEQGSRLMVALADSLGVSIGQLRKMAAEGKLTTDVVVKGLLSQGDAIGKEFAKTTRTMSQAFQEAGNNLTKFLGENTTIKASINVFSDAVITASKSLDEMVLAVSLVASVVGGRYIAAMGLAIKAKMQSAVAARQEAIANLQAARVAEHNAIMTARKTALDLAAARALVEKAKTEFAAARGTNAEATALANLIAVRSAATTAAINHKQATQAQTAAMANSAAAARAASVSIGLANKALGFVGGPAGIAMAAGAAIMYFYQQAKEAREEAVKLAEGVNQLTAEMKNMTREQKRAESAKLKEALPELKNEVLNTTVAMKQAAEKVRELEADLALAKVGTSKYESITKQLADAQDKLAIATDNATKASNNYSRTKNTISFIQADLNGELKEGIDLLKREISVLPSGAKGWDSYGFSIDRALQKKKEFNGEKISFEWSKEGMDLRKSLEREMKLANAKSEVDKRLLQVDFYIEDKGITDEREIYQLKQIAIATQKAQDAAAERNKTTKESTKATDAAYEALKRQREEIELLNKGYKDGSLEMAKYDAVKALGDKASPEQIKLAEKLAEDKYNIERNLADKKAALDLDLVTKAKESHDKQLADLERITKDDVSLTEQAARRKAEIEAEYQQKIAEIKANNAVSPQDDIKGKVDPVQQLKNEHERKLALIREFETEKGAITQRGLELMNVANTQYEQDRLNAQWEIWRNQSQANQFLADGLDALGQRSTNVLTGLLTQTQSINDAFRNVALTIVDQAVGALVQMGMQQVKNMVTESAMRKASNAQAIAEATTTGAAITNAMAPAAATTSIATMGSAATWGMAAMAIAIPAMIALAGARKNGGPVNAGSMYRVGEGGKPEIFKASNGSQYMIPGDNGRVISNRQISKGGNGVSMGDMNFTFQVQAPNGITQKEAQQIQQMVRGTVYDVLGNEMRSGGALEKVRSW